MTTPHSTTTSTEILMETIMVTEAPVATADELSGEVLSFQPILAVF